MSSAHLSFISTGILPPYIIRLPTFTIFTSITSGPACAFETISGLTRCNVNKTAITVKIIFIYVTSISYSIIRLGYFSMVLIFVYATYGLYIPIDFFTSYHSSVSKRMIDIKHCAEQPPTYLFCFSL